MATANGTLMRVHVTSATIDCEVTSTFSSSFSIDKTACKDNPNGTLKPGPIDFSISGEALVELAGSGQNSKDLLLLHLNKTEFACDYILSEAGGYTIAAAAAYLNSFEMTGGTEEFGRFNFGIAGSGDYTVT